MELVFKGEIYDMVQKSDGLVFSYKKGEIDGRLVVGFKMISVENGIMTDVAKNVYLLSKYGSNYRAATGLCSNYVTAKSIPLLSGRILVLDSGGTAAFIDADGIPGWTGELKYRGAAPSAAAVYKNGLWACFAASNVLLRFNFATMREELRVGGGSSGTASPFASPRDIFIDGSQAVVSNAASNKILKIDLESYTVSDFYEFSEPVYGYLKTGNYQFALLESGLYSV